MAYFDLHHLRPRILDDGSWLVRGKQQSATPKPIFVGLESLMSCDLDEAVNVGFAAVNVLA